MYKKARRAVGMKLRECGFPYRAYAKKHKCIYIHIPKAAGTSILKFLGDPGTRRDHLPWFVYYTANSARFQRYFKFAFVRNPWDRAYSAYNYLRKGGNGTSDQTLLNAVSEYDDFDTFVKRGLGLGYFRNHLLFLPQSEFVLDGMGRCVVDFLGRVESFDSDMKEVAGKLSMPYQNNSILHNASNAIPVVISEESCQIIESLYRQDCLSFGYSLEDSVLVRRGG